MNFAFIMDPLETVKAYKDTTYHLMLAARERDHTVFYLDQGSLHVNKSVLYADLWQVEVHEDNDKPFTLVDRRVRPLADMDVVLVRTDPPFDRAYFYTTLMLDLLPASTRVVNRPEGLRNWNEKLSALNYPELSPETLITNSTDDVVEFATHFDRVTLKPIDGHGGKGIYFVRSGDANIRETIEKVSRGGSHWIIAQRYLPEATVGDKRILILDGEPLGAILRVAGEGAELNNLDQGGSANPVDMTARDYEICAALKDGLNEQGIRFSGIDVIGDCLVEINVTSPTGLQELTRFSGVAHHHAIIERLETAEVGA